MSARIVLHGDDDELRHVREMHWDLADLDDHRELHGWPDGVIGHHHIDAADLDEAAPCQHDTPEGGAAGRLRQPPPGRRATTTPS